MNMPKIYLLGVALATYGAACWGSAQPAIAEQKYAPSTPKTQHWVADFNQKTLQGNVDKTPVQKLVHKTYTELASALAICLANNKKNPIQAKNHFLQVIEHGIRQDARSIKEQFIDNYMAIKREPSQISALPFDLRSEAVKQAVLATEALLEWNKIKEKLNPPSDSCCVVS